MEVLFYSVLFLPVVLALVLVGVCIAEERAVGSDIPRWGDE